MVSGSNSVAGAPNVLFLGAGASHSLGKMLMREFVEHLKKRPEISSYALFHDIIGKDADLEFLMEELEDISRKGYLNYQFASSPYPPPPPSIAPQRLETTFGEAAALASRLSRLIRQEIFLHYRDFQDVQQIEPLFRPLFDRFFAGTGAPLVVFTTNYDPAIERFCELAAKEYQCVDGFRHDPVRGEYVWSPSVFESPPLRSDRRNVVLFKLHGSANWISEGERILRILPLFVEGDKQYSNLMIYPATRKVVDKEPFFTCYEYLQECLRYARYCLVIGYSFRDYDAITRIRAARRRSPELRIQVLDISPSKVEKHLKKFDIAVETILAPFTSTIPLTQVIPFTAASASP